MTDVTVAFGVRNPVTKQYGFLAVNIRFHGQSGPSDDDIEHGYEDRMPDVDKALKHTGFIVDMPWYISSKTGTLLRERDDRDLLSTQHRHIAGFQENIPKPDVVYYETDDTIIRPIAKERICMARHDWVCYDCTVPLVYKSSKKISGNVIIRIKVPSTAVMGQNVEWYERQRREMLRHMIARQGFRDWIGDEKESSVKKYKYERIRVEKAAYDENERLVSAWAINGFGVSVNAYLQCAKILTIEDVHSSALVDSSLFWGDDEDPESSSSDSDFEESAPKRKKSKSTKSKKEKSKPRK